jgi:hypothetical protein
MQQGFSTSIFSASLSAWVRVRVMMRVRVRRMRVGVRMGVRLQTRVRVRVKGFTTLEILGKEDTFHKWCILRPQHCRCCIRP